MDPVSVTATDQIELYGRLWPGARIGVETPPIKATPHDPALALNLSRTLKSDFGHPGVSHALEHTGFCIKILEDP